MSEARQVHMLAYQWLEGVEEHLQNGTRHYYRDGKLLSSLDEVVNAILTGQLTIKAQEGGLMYLNRHSKKISHILGNLQNGIPFALCSPYEGCMGDEAVTITDDPEYGICEACLALRAGNEPGKPFPDNLRIWIDRQAWTTAKTNLQWPHEYLMKFGKERQAYRDLIIHIRKHGYVGEFYQLRHRYFEDVNGLLYWTMEGLPEDTIVINRCVAEDSYDRRKAEGRLP